MPQKQPKGSRHIDRHMVSLPAELYKAARKAAKEAKRPINWEVRIRLEESLRKDGHLPPEQS